MLAPLLALAAATATVSATSSYDVFWEHGTAGISVGQSAQPNVNFKAVYSLNWGTAWCDDEFGNADVQQYTLGALADDTDPNLTFQMPDYLQVGQERDGQQIIVDYHWTGEKYDGYCSGGNGQVVTTCDRTEGTADCSHFGLQRFVDKRMSCYAKPVEVC